MRPVSCCFNVLCDDVMRCEIALLIHDLRLPVSPAELSMRCCEREKGMASVLLITLPLNRAFP